MRGLLVALPIALASVSVHSAETPLTLHEREYLSTRGVDVLVFSNWYDGNFSDSKIAGVEIIHHGVRTATNGDVRLSPTPEQWDPVPELKSRNVDRASGAIEARLAYPQQKFEYVVRAEPKDGGVLLRVILENALPESLQGRAGFNLEFLPSAYFSRTFLMDSASGILPLYPSGPTRLGSAGVAERMPIASGRKLVLAPEDPERRVAIEARGTELALFDGRNQAQNGWYVVRSLIPSGAQGTVLEWFVSANAIPDWTRTPVITHSQVGYHPNQAKVALIELDANAAAPGRARLLRVGADGALSEALAADTAARGDYLRYKYFAFDFTAAREPGLYVIEAAGERTRAFRIAPDVYAQAWQQTLDVFFPVQMDHMFVNEAYRVWHGASHLDDARQAPVNHEHFDLYAQGATTDSPFKPGEHIPGLNIGGWYDAGDFDLRTQTHYATVMSLVHTWEKFRPMRDETAIDQAKRHVELHHPDGTPDLLQQIEHGTLMLIAQHRVFGHAIPGIVEPDLGQYTHLGDAVTKTDNRIDDPMRPDSASDDRLAFTTATTALNYGSAAALAAASRALRGYRDALADECIATARKVWDYEKQRTPNLFRFGNTTGGDPADEELRAAVELLITTQDARYAKRINQLWPTIDKRFEQHASLAVRALPHMDKAFAARLRKRAGAYREQMKTALGENPFEVPITRGGWAGSGAVVGFALSTYHLHTAFPDLFTADHTLRGLEFLYGRHPGSNISFVSGVGTHSKSVAYGSNRADFSFIAGGVVPGVLILKPDFPENKEDWPFLWGENEYVIGLAASYIFLVHAANELVGAPAAATSRAHLVDRTRIDAALKSLVDQGALVGVSALVFEAGQEAYFGAFGLADREARKPMTRDTVVQIFSMTKPVTGVALMQLYEEGRFELDDPLAKYAREFADLKVYTGVDATGAPQFEAPARPVTIRDIMRHTGGLVSGDDDPSPVGAAYKRLNPMRPQNTLVQMARELGKVPLLYQPGTRWLYGPSVDVQAFLVERLSGQPFDRYLAKHIFEPLRMTHTRHLISARDYSRFAALYTRNDDGTFTRIPDEEAYAPHVRRDWPLKRGGAGLVSTLDDYSRFARMLLNGGELDGVRILQPETVRLMATNAMPAVRDRSWLPSKGQVGFGIDFAVRIAPPASAEEASGEVGEFFWDGAANTLFWVDPENQIAAVLFTQYRPFGLVPLHKAFRDAVYATDPTAFAH